MDRVNLSREGAPRVLLHLESKSENDEDQVAKALECMSSPNLYAYSERN